MIRMKTEREPRTRAQKAWIAVGLASLATLGVAMGAATVWPAAESAKTPPGIMDMPTAVAAAEGKVIAAEAEAPPEDSPAAQTAAEPEATLAAATSSEGGSEAAFKVNLNLADASQLATVPGFGKVKAKAILAFRQEHPFQVTADIMKVKGMGPASYARVKEYLAVSGPPLVGSPPKHNASRVRTKRTRAT